MTFAALLPFADRAALFTALRQDALSTATASLGEHRWDVDMTAGTLVFSANADPAHQLVTRAHLIATIASGPRSLLWAWAHSQGDPQGVAARIRNYGVEHGVAELSDPEVLFPAEASGDDEWIAGAARTVGAAAIELTGIAPFHVTPVDGGTHAVFVMEAPLQPVTVTSAVAALPHLLTGTELLDARTAVWDLARLAGWGLKWTDEAFSGADVTDASGSATFRFDKQARIIGIESATRRGLSGSDAPPASRGGAVPAGRSVES